MFSLSFVLVVSAARKHSAAPQTGGRPAAILMSSPGTGLGTQKHITLGLLILGESLLRD